MTRYYFHQRIDGELLLDPDGYDYANSAAARAAALASARSLWAMAVLEGEDLSGQAIEIVDEQRMLLDTVPLEEALPPFLTRYAA